MSHQSLSSIQNIQSNNCPVRSSTFQHNAKVHGLDLNPVLIQIMTLLLFKIVDKSICWLSRNYSVFAISGSFQSHEICICAMHIHIICAQASFALIGKLAEKSVFVVHQGWIQQKCWLTFITSLGNHQSIQDLGSQMPAFISIDKGRGGMSKCKTFPFNIELREGSIVQ